MKYRTRIMGILTIFVLSSLVFTSAVMAQQDYSVCDSDSTLPIESGGAWTTAAPMPTPRSEIAAAVLEDKIYVAGGLVSRQLGSVTDAFEAYDIENDTWAQLAPVPSLLHHSAVAALDGKVYIIGGYGSLSFDAFADGWRYDPATDTWTAIADMPASRGAHQLLAFDDRLWVIGGTGPDAAQVWVYDPANDTWDAEVTSLSGVRNHLAAVASDTMIYVIAGRVGSGSIGLVERYSPADDTWETLPDVPTVRSGVTAALVEGRIHFTGGEALDGNSCTYHQHEVFDLESETWLAYQPLPVPRHGLTSAAVDGRWVVIGGATAANQGTLDSVTAMIDVFTPTSDADE